MQTRQNKRNDFYDTLGIVVTIKRKAAQNFSNSFLITNHINMDDKARSEVVRQRLNAKLASRTVSTSTADDFVRHLHSFKYTFLKETDRSATFFFPIDDDDDDDDDDVPPPLIPRADVTESDDDNDDCVPDPASSATVPANVVAMGKALEDTSSTPGEGLGASTGETLSDEGAGEDSSVWVAGSNENELGPLSYFDPDVLRVTRKVMHLQVDQKKVELRNLGMEVPDDLSILQGLDTWSLFGFINEALEKDPATNLFYQQL